MFDNLIAFACSKFQEPAIQNTYNNLENAVNNTNLQSNLHNKPTTTTTTTAGTLHICPGLPHIIRWNERCLHSRVGLEEQGGGPWQYYKLITGDIPDRASVNSPKTGPIWNS